MHVHSSGMLFNFSHSGSCSREMYVLRRCDIPFVLAVIERMSRIATAYLFRDDCMTVVFD